MFGEELVNNPNSLFNLAERKNGHEEQECNQQQEEAQTLSHRDKNIYEESSSCNLDDKIIGRHAADSEMEVADKALQNTDDESATKHSTHQNHYEPNINMEHDKETNEEEDDIMSDAENKLDQRWSALSLDGQTLKVSYLTLQLSWVQAQGLSLTGLLAGQCVPASGSESGLQSFQ